jgi:hypothetical protein
MDLDFGIGLFNGLDLNGFHFGSGLGLVFQGTSILKTGIQNLMSRFHRISIGHSNLSATPWIFHWYRIVTLCLILSRILDIETVEYKDNRRFY